LTSTQGIFYSSLISEDGGSGSSDGGDGGCDGIIQHIDLYGSRIAASSLLTVPISLGIIPME